MAMEAVGFLQDSLGYYTGRELYTLLDGSGGGSSWSFDLEDTVAGFGLYDQPPLMSDYPPPLWNDESNALEVPASLHITEAAPAAEDRPKRRRVKKSRKNKEDIEAQRMTHIAVERNRRKQMNDYLAVLRSLMPESYVQRSDQASIIGGAINFVKELEQQLHLLDATKHTHHHQHLPPRTDVTATSSSSSTSASQPPPLPFSEFFTLPQYSTTTCSDSTATTTHHSSSLLVAAAAQTQSSSVADIEVTMVESHANMKIRSRKRPKQLLRLVSGLQNLRLTVLHLNVSTVDHIVLYSLSLKVEDDCKLTSVDEIASAVYEILLRIQEEQVV